MGRAFSKSAFLAATGYVSNEDDTPARSPKGMSALAMHSDNQIKIGRQTNQKTTPGERNAYFDSKVLSRTHAEIWTENGRVGPNMLVQR
jgi:hypothetical protein